MTNEENRANVARYNRKISEVMGKLLTMRGELLAFSEVFREQHSIESRIDAHARILSAAAANLDNMRPMIYMLEEDVKDRVPIDVVRGKKKSGTSK